MSWFRRRNKAEDATKVLNLALLEKGNEVNKEVELGTSELVVLKRIIGKVNDAIVQEERVEISNKGEIKALEKLFEDVVKISKDVSQIKGDIDAAEAEANSDKGAINTLSGTFVKRSYRGWKKEAAETAKRAKARRDNLKSRIDIVKLGKHKDELLRYARFTKDMEDKIEQETKIEEEETKAIIGFILYLRRMIDNIKSKFAQIYSLGRKNG